MGGGWLFYGVEVEEGGDGSVVGVSFVEGGELVGVEFFVVEDVVYAEGGDGAADVGLAGASAGFSEGVVEVVGEDVVGVGGGWVVEVSADDDGVG